MIVISSDSFLALLLKRQTLQSFPVNRGIKGEIRGGIKGEIRGED